MRSLNVIDNVFKAARISLDGLAAKQEAIARNIVNVDTPGYRAQTVSYEQAVKAVLERDNQITLRTSTIGHQLAKDMGSVISQNFRPGGSVRADGNNVDIDVELVSQNEALTRYETVTQLVNSRFKLLKEIANR